MDKPTVTASVSHAWRFSPVWIVPIVSLIAAGWMIYQYLVQQGPRIYLTVLTAEGIEPGKTLIKARSVKVGMVTDVKLGKDYKQIDLTAQMDSGTERMLRADSEFWLVKPRIGSSGVTGLETLLSGPYIELSPGEGRKKQTHFVMLSAPPVAGPDEQGIRVMLVSDKAGKLSVGDPVMYEGYVVGRVEKVGFDVGKRQATYQLFIFQPYNSLLRTRSRFWLNSGIDFTLNSQGFNIAVESLETLIAGGVTFAVPEGSAQGHPVGKKIPEFVLYDNLQAVRVHMYEKVLPYAMLFNYSVRGLSVGAPVEYRGVRIGSVAQVPLVIKGIDAMKTIEIPVLINIELERIEQLSSDEQTLAELEQGFARAIDHGLRAALKTGNLLSGALYVDINFYPDQVQPSSLASTQRYHGYRLFPTVEGEFVLLQQQVEHILKKFERLPMDDTVHQLNQTLAQFDNAGKQLQTTLRQIDSLLAQKETQQLPQTLWDTLNDLQSTLKGYSPASDNYAEIRQALLHVNEVLEQLEPLLRTLNQQPDALIFGSEEPVDPTPVKGGAKP